MNDDKHLLIYQKPQNLCDILNKKSKKTRLSSCLTKSHDKDSLSSTYSRISGLKKIKKNTAKWTLTETQIFFRAIVIYGLEFQLMSQVFPMKTSKQLLRKYHQEFKKNRRQIDYAMKIHENTDKS